MNYFKQLIKLTIHSIINSFKPKLPKFHIKDFQFEISHSMGLLAIQNPQLGVLVLGNSGTGKTENIMKPITFQWAIHNISMTIYELDKLTPELGLLAYNSCLSAKEEQYINLKKPVFEILSIDLLKESIRPNPINPKIRSFHELNQILKAFVFKEERAMGDDIILDKIHNLFLKITFKLIKNPKLHHLCTIPHILYLISQQTPNTLKWIEEDIEDTLLLEKIKSYNYYITPELFWLFGAEIEKQSPLDFNNPNSPVILSIIDKLDTPISAYIRSTITSSNYQIDSVNKHPYGLILSDQVPYIPNLSEIINTARGRKRSIVIEAQNEADIEHLYNKSYPEIICCLETQIIGSTKNKKTVDRLPSNFNKTELYQKISNQPMGHFLGFTREKHYEAHKFFSIKTISFNKNSRFKVWNNNLVLNPKETAHKNLSTEEFLEIVNDNYQRIIDECNTLLNIK